MKKLLLLTLAALIFFGGVLTFRFLLASGRPRITPLESRTGGKPAAPLPKDAVVLTVADGAEVVAPFVVHDEAGAVGGVAAFQPKGSRNDEHIGRVKFTAKLETAGNYSAWVHTKWRDSCSNSCSLKVGVGTEASVGNDDVFNVWHWVPAGKHTFAPGENSVAVIEREDGIYVDQILFTQDAAYIPTGAITTAGVLRDVRRFADTFTRSPGHGNEGWEFQGKGKFDIAFSFDPNRIPNQYALSGDAKAGPCFAFVQGAPWYGCKISYSFMPTSEGQYGCIVDKNADSEIRYGFDFSAGKPSVFFNTGSGVSKSPLEIDLRLNQWHRVVVEHWAFVTHIWLDDKRIFSSYRDNTKAGKAGMFVEKGTAVFDDFEIEEIAWMADDGKDYRIDWTQSDGAKWFRAEFPAGSGMLGESGTIKAGLGGIPLEEIAIDEEMTPPAPPTSEDLEKAIAHPGEFVAVSSTPIKPNPKSCGVLAPGLKAEGYPGGSIQAYRLPPNADGSCTHAVFSAAPQGVEFRRVALRFGRHTPQTYNVGPYTFSTREMEDPSDYLDFTEAEYKEMARSPEAAKLKRHAKIKSIISHAGDEEAGPWGYLSGNWSIDTREGFLRGRSAGARLRHSQEIASDMEMRFKIRLTDATTIGEVELYSGADPGLRVQFAPPTKQPTPLPAGVAMRLDTPLDKQWHEVTLRVDGSKLAAKFDRAPLREAEFARGDGDRIMLKVANGIVDFDDVEFIVQRVTDKSVLYAFNQPEPDWLRAPAEKWIDHGGIACVLASSWISLVAPEGRGTIWNKRAFKPDILLAFNVEENSEWYGWDKYPNHTHFPFDNIEATLANEKDPAVNYTLTVNAEGHTFTTLVRNGKEVARIRQDGSFPMRYIGSHMPFLPRVNRVCLIKRGGLLRGIVNGKEVLTFADPSPLDVTKVGVGGHDTRINFSHIEIVNVEK